MKKQSNLIKEILLNLWKLKLFILYILFSYIVVKIALSNLNNIGNTLLRNTILFSIIINTLVLFGIGIILINKGTAKIATDSKYLSKENRTLFNSLWIFILIVPAISALSKALANLDNMSFVRNTFIEFIIYYGLCIIFLAIIQAQMIEN